MTRRTDDDVAARLAAIADYNILNTPAEQGFDDIVLIASQLCATPVALVTLLEQERQWFKAKVGTEMCSTPIGTAICAHALQQSSTLVIPDLASDPRTRTNPLVTEPPHVRFYAGAPLVTPDGLVIGTVCVLDTEPRPVGLTLGQTTALEALSRQVVALLELRKTTREETAELRESDTRSRVAQEAGRVGTFELNVATGEMTVSSEFCRIYGLPDVSSYSAAQIEALVLREDAKVRSDSESRQDGSAALSVEYRIRRSVDGALRWVDRRADFERDALGNAVRMFGTVQDITERRQLQTYQAALLEVGDRLRAAATSRQAVSIASEVIGRTLGVSRAGYAYIDVRANSYEVEQDWTAPGTASMAGRYPLDAFRGTIDHLARNQTIALANVEAANWLASDMEGYRAGDIKAQIKVPMIVGGELVGLLYAHQTEPRTWTEHSVDFAHGVADRTYAALAKLKAESDQRIQNQEISHRLKNALSLVQAIATQSLRSIADRGPIETFEKRLHALGSAHDVLMRDSGKEAPIRTIIATVLQSIGQGGRVKLSGPKVEFGARATMSLSLLVHELATNALKYGALSVPDGEVAISWELTGTDADMLAVHWRETGGPPAHPPTRKGFGSRLISLGLIGTGGVELRYTPHGFEADMTAPVAQVEHS